MEFSLLRYVILVFSLNLFLIIVDSQYNDFGSSQTPPPPQPTPPPLARHPSPPKTPSGPHSPLPPSKSSSHHPSLPLHSKVNATSSPPPLPHSEENAILPPLPLPPQPPPQSPLQPNHNNSSVVTDKIGDKKAHTGNTGKKIGLLFIGIAGFLQICVVGFLVLKRQQLMKIEERNENCS